MLFRSRRAGGDGCISVTANVTPALCAALHRACDRSDDTETARLEAILSPVHEAMFLEANPIPVKRALGRLGLMVDELRLPLTPLSAVADVQLAEVLKKVMPLEEQESRHPVSPGRRFFRSRAA